MRKMFVLNYKRTVSEICFQTMTLRFDLDIKAGCYHAGLSASSRTQVHERWLKNQVHVICATIAFGLFAVFSLIRMEIFLR